MLVMENIITPRVESLVGIESYPLRYAGRNTAQRGTEDQLRSRAVGVVRAQVMRVGDGDGAAPCGRFDAPAARIGGAHVTCLNGLCDSAHVVCSGNGRAAYPPGVGWLSA
jgi:hypothetical protein